MTSLEPSPATTAQAGSPDRALLDRGLAIARHGRGLTFIAVPAAVASPAAILDLPGLGATVAWASPDGLVLVGIGLARELRASGPERWSAIARAARAIVVDGAVIRGESMPLAALEKARPRFLGGGAFATGGADRAPWTGFGDAWFALPRWTYVRDGNVAQLVLAVDAVEAADQARWFAELAQLRRALTDGFAAHAQPALVELAPSPGATYRTQVTAIVDAIADGRCAKIVAARTCELAFAGGVRVADLFASLDARHGECARVLVRPTPAGALLAATPERLVRKRGDLVECDALAGTATTEHAAALLASGKDRREHEHVISAIRDALAEAGDVVVEPTAIRALRHVLHLHAPIRATLRAPTHVLELVARLHPTPAVGGTPTRVAVDWIAAHEPAPRGWYAAPVGWFDLDGDGELAVAIRSGVITGDRAHLWAGAGIVAGSDPDRELVETENKLRAMLGALGVVG